MFKFISSVDAAETSFEKGVMKVAHNFSDIIFTPIVWLLTGASMIMFFWGLAHFILSEDATAKDNGKNHMIWGVAGLFIIVAVWGIIALISNTVKSFG